MQEGALDEMFSPLSPLNLPADYLRQLESPSYGRDGTSFSSLQASDEQRQASTKKQRTERAPDSACGGATRFRQSVVSFPEQEERARRERRKRTLCALNASVTDVNKTLRDILSIQDKLLQSLAKNRRP